MCDRYAVLAQRFENRLAVADSTGRRLSHGMLWRESGRLAEKLTEGGIGRGDIVILLLPNIVDAQVAFVALLRLGAIPASLPTRTDPETVAHVARLTGARALVSLERHGTAPLGDIAREAASTCGHEPGVFLFDEGAGTWRNTPAGQRTPLPASATDLAHIMFTSSTTGRPKAVMHSEDTLAALNIGFTDRFSLGPDAPIFFASPLGHSIGAIHGARLSLHTGAPLVLQDVWNPERALEAIEEFGCAFTAAATPFLKDLVDARWPRSTPKLAPLRSFLCGGAQVPPSLMEAAQAHFPNTFVTVLWGMTEGGLVTCVRESPSEKLMSTAGIGLPGLELRCLDAAGGTVPAGEEGELVMRGPGVFIGYFGQQDLYDSLITDDGFFRTGDLARIDADGYVRITGRLKDLIIRGGVNISPAPIENALADHPDVHAVAVIGHPDERLGERICAVVVAHGATPSLEDLIAHARAKRLPKHHCPEVLRIVDSMPMTPAGKIRKADLRAIVTGDGAASGDGA
ncbi:MAG: AMP-binding protein [Rhodospirillales bacterium]|nr:AMP-binding protein [Rhodospirillales bacterium]